MTSTIQMESSVLENPAKPEHVQFLPCIVEEDINETQVETRFSSFSTTNKKLDCLENQLRGRPLDGLSMKLPEGYTGLVVEGPRAGLTDQDRSLRATASFNSFTYWNYDKIPGEADAWQQATQWTTVAAALHED